MLYSLVPLIFMFTLSLEAQAGPVVLATKLSYPESPVALRGVGDGKDLLFVEYGAHRVARISPSGQVTTYWKKEGCGPAAVALLSRPATVVVTCYDENRIYGLSPESAEVEWTLELQKGPNDLIEDPEGGFFITASGVFDPKSPIEGRLFHVTFKEGKPSAMELADDLHYPNGVALSGDGKRLVVSEHLAGRILEFALERTGQGVKLGGRKVFVTLRELLPDPVKADPKMARPYLGPDGLKRGPDGNFYVAQFGAGRVLVITPDGKLVRAISVPMPFVTNLGFSVWGMEVTAVRDHLNAPYEGALFRFKR